MSKLQQVLTELDALYQHSRSTLLPSLEELCQFLSDSLAFSHIIVSKEDVHTILTTQSDESTYDEHSRIVLGYRAAFDFMLQVAKRDPLEISESFLKQLHHLIFSYYESIPTDQYRTTEYVDIMTNYHSPSPLDLDHVMPHLGDQFRSSLATLHPVELSAMMTKRMLDIHPFPEGNHRIAHLIMNVILIHYGYPVISIPPCRQEEYNNAILIARTDYDMDPLSLLFATLLIENIRSHS